MTMTEEEHERWHKEQAEVTPEQHEALVKQIGISEEADREWHKTQRMLQGTPWVEMRVATAQYVTVTEDALIIDLADGRTVSVPLAWYPRLLHGTSEERNNWRLIGKGEGIHWPDLDEDLSVENIVFGKPSGESQRSFKMQVAMLICW